MRQQSFENDIGNMRKLHKIKDKVVKEPHGMPNAAVI